MRLMEDQIPGGDVELKGEGSTLRKLPRSLFWTFRAPQNRATLRGYVECRDQIKGTY